MLRTLLQDQVDAFTKLGAAGGQLIPRCILEIADCETTKAEPLPELCTPKECFVNAGKLVLDTSSLLYVEGFIVTEDMAFPIHHAWAYDPARDIVIETTLRAKGRTVHYLGKKFNQDQFIKELALWEYWGLFDGVGPNLDLISRLSPTLKDEINATFS